MNQSGGASGPLARLGRRAAWALAFLALVGFVSVAEATLSLVFQGRAPSGLFSVLSVLVVVIGSLATSLVVVAIWERRERDLAGQARELAALRGATAGRDEGRDFAAALERLVDSGRAAVQARYAALAVLGPDRRVERFVSAGPAPAERQALDFGLREVGLLNAMDRAAAPLFVDDLARDPEVARFLAPPPPARTFLGVPVLASGAKVGLLYCADKLGPGQRVVPFAPEDARAIGLVADEAAVVIVSYRRSQPPGPAGRPGEGGEIDHDAAVRLERERIGRELHDGVIQSLYALGLGLEAAIQALEVDVPLARSRLIQARDTINNVIQEIRNYLVGLRAAAVDGPPLATRLADVADELSLNLHEEIAPDVERALNPTQAQQLFLIAREALINAAKHAQASQVTLVLEPSRGGWTLRVRDNGVGFVPSQVPTTSFGLQTMRERARLLGGRLTVSSRPGQGTEVKLVVPQAA
jgi:signal transduction histidine kinase